MSIIYEIYFNKKAKIDRLVNTFYYLVSTGKGSTTVG